jgi:O-antigen ligase
MSDWHLIHNSFIQIFSETGLLGLSFYMLLFFLPYKQYRNYTSHNIVEGDLHHLRFGMVILSFVGYTVTVIFLPQAYSPILYMLTGIAIIQSELIKKEKGY